MSDKPARTVRTNTMRTVGVNRLADAYCIRRELDQSGRAIYEGYTLPGLGQRPSNAVWAIRMLAYTGANTIADTEMWAEGTADYALIWDDRATYTYR